MPQHNFSGPQRSTLVCLLGSHRGGVKAWQSLFHHVLDPLDASLALSGPQTHAEQAMLYRRAKFVWHDIPEHDDVRA